MYRSDQHLHFVGIGGVGMAPIAEVLLNLGYSVSGSDVQRNHLIEHLEELGARIALGHAAENVPVETTGVVTSSAIRSDNPEIHAATERGIIVIPRAEMLAELMRMKYGIAIAGSHGKTTTTSLSAHLLTEAGLDPTVIIGGRFLNKNSGATIGSGKYLVAESDESDGSFCLLRPAISVVTNIDKEHLGFYGSFGALEDAFAEFMGSVPFYGLVIACFDDPVVKKLATGLKRRVLSYGLLPDNEISARDISVEGLTTHFTLVVHGEEAGRVELPLLGRHMVSNTLAVLGLALELGVPLDAACRSFASFPGVVRRTEVVGEHGGVRVVDDYGHHPSEIRATLAALKNSISNSEQGRLVVLFQPHRYSRTRDLFSEFVDSFGDADEVVIGEVYAAGEDAIDGINGEKLASAVQHPSVSFVRNLPDAIDGLLPTLSSGDVVVTLGAGDVGQVAHQFAKRLQTQAGHQ